MSLDTSIPTGAFGVDGMEGWGVASDSSSCHPTFSGGYSLEGPALPGVPREANEGDGSSSYCRLNLPSLCNPMNLDSLLDLSIRWLAPEEPASDSHQRLADLPLDSCSSGTVLIAMLRMGERTG